MERNKSMDEYRHWLSDRIEYFESILDEVPTMKNNIKFVTALVVYKQCYKVLIGGEE